MYKQLLQFKTFLLVCLLAMVGTSNVWAETVTDVLTASDFKATGTTYTDFSEVSKTSDAVYAGQSAKDSSGNIQLRSKNSNSGIVSTTSGGKVKSVKITIASGTNTIDVYGYNTAFTSASDLYNTNATKVGSLTETGTITFTDDYEYVGIRSNNGAVYISSIEIVWEVNGGSNAVATTTTIDASGITNTDVYTDAAAGKLVATVKADETTLDNAPVTWSGDNDKVATIDAYGNVSLVAAGTVTFTASYAGVAGEYKASSAKYEMTVTSSAPYVQPTEIEITPNYTFWGKTAQFSGSTNDELSGTQDNLTLEWSRGEGSTYANTTAMRFYKDNTLTFTAPSGYEIKSIVLTVSGTYSDLIFAQAGYDSKTTTWSGSSATVTMSRPSNASSYATISKYTITIGLPSSIAAPTFSVPEGDYIEPQNVSILCETEGATIYYTTNGTIPSATNGTEGTSVTINTTTTLKAIAIKDGESSVVTTATYTFPTIYANIAAFVEANTTAYLNTNDAQVVYIDNDKKYIYVRDTSGAIVLYEKNGFNTSLKTGDILGGVLHGTYSPYKNLPEITSVSLENVSVKGNEVVVPKVIAGTTESIQANLCDLVKIEGTEITENESKYYVGDNADIQLYDNFNVGYTVETGKTVDVAGIATVYNTTYELFPRYEEDIVYLDNSVEVNIPSTTGYATFSSTKAVDFTAVDAIYAYTATISGDIISFNRVEKVPANTGVLLYSSAGGSVATTNVPVLSGDADDVTGNRFVAVSEDITSLETEVGTNTNYILNVVGGVVGFYQAAGKKVGAGKAYLSVPTGANIRGFVLPDGTTGITSVEGTTIEGMTYDLQGRRVSTPKTGLYIINGKKVLVK